jgi:hypothetical protein
VKVALAHGKYPEREIIERGVAYRLKVLGYREVAVIAYKFIEDLLDSSLDYDVFVIYSNLGKHLNGPEGAAVLRGYKPDARIIGVTTMHPKATRFRDLGALGIVYPGEDEIAQICDIILNQLPPPAKQCPKTRARPRDFVEGRRLEGEMIWLYGCPDCKLNCLISIAHRTRAVQGRPVSLDEVDELRQIGESVLKANDVLANKSAIRWLP